MMSRLLPIICLLIAVALFFGYVNPTRSGSIASTKAQIASYDSALTAADTFKQKESQLVIAKANIPSDKLARLQSYLPDGVDNVQIILDLNALAARSGVTLSDFKTQVTTQNGQDASAGVPAALPSSTLGGAPVGGADGTLALEAQSPIQSLDITVAATGTYPAFRQFLTGIETSLRQLDVTSVSVQDSATGVYTYQMTIRLYWLR